MGPMLLRGWEGEERAGLLSGKSPFAPALFTWEPSPRADLTRFGVWPAREGLAASHVRSQPAPQRGGSFVLREQCLTLGRLPLIVTAHIPSFSHRTRRF